MIASEYSEWTEAYFKLVGHNVYGEIRPFNGGYILIQWKDRRSNYHLYSDGKIQKNQNYTSSS